jgi:hypothetical protein
VGDDERLDSVVADRGEQPEAGIGENLEVLAIDDLRGLLAAIGVQRPSFSLDRPWLTRSMIDPRQTDTRRTSASDTAIKTMLILIAVALAIGALAKPFNTAATHR